MDAHSTVYIAGHKGLVGSGIYRRLKHEGYTNIVVRTSKELDLRNQAKVASFFSDVKPEYVFLAAAKVGGILANSTYPAEYIYDNLMIQTNIIHQAYLSGVKKLLFLGSSCIYPKLAPQPMKEEHLLTGKLEPSNEPYAIAKIAGIKMCQSYNCQYGTKFISAMPSNLYGPGDNFDLETSHVLAAMIRKYHEAKINNHDYLVLWGTGSPKREFLYVDDLADACLFLIKNYDSNEIINIGTGQDLTIEELAELVGEIVGYNCRIKWNTTMPEGTPRKLLDVSKLHQLNWKQKTTLKEGIKKTYEWFKNNI